jgi:FAD/FMN-containing dehydrogenase
MPRPSFNGRWLTDQADMAPFLTDWRKLWHGRAMAVAQPETAEDVAKLVGWCAAEAVPIVPQGGNTGLSGGATPDDSGRSVVLSLARLNRVRAIDTENATMTVEAGCVLRDVQAAADAAGSYFPLSLAAEGTCTIGGNLATNAGGTAVLRYGNARDLCLGLEVVTATGTLWDGLRGLRKDNTGYDLRDLFIGSEGTLGVITASVLKLYPAPASRSCALLAVETPAQAVDLVADARHRFDAMLTGAEIFSETCLGLVLAHVPATRRPLATRAPWYVLIEVSGPASEDHLRAELEALLMSAFERGQVQDGAIAQSFTQARQFWALREAVSDSQGAAGPAIKHDIAVPISRLPAFLEAAGMAVRHRWPDLGFVTFGHLGDGNIHYNFSPAPGLATEAFLARQDELNRIVHDIVLSHGGSLSAEHGLGVLRHREAARARPPIETALMRQIKQALDPQNIMNPGKVLP